MKGLKIIPIFAILLLCTYVGIQFVEQNRDTVVVQFWSFQARPAALGLVVLTSILIGMILAGTLCSLELMVLVMQNRRLRRKLPTTTHAAKPASVSPKRETFGESASVLSARAEADEVTKVETDSNKANRFTPL